MQKARKFMVPWHRVRKGEMLLGQYNVTDKGNLVKSSAGHRVGKDMENYAKVLVLSEDGTKEITWERVLYNGDYKESGMALAEMAMAGFEPSETGILWELVCNRRKSSKYGNGRELKEEVVA